MRISLFKIAAFISCLCLVLVEHSPADVQQARQIIADRISPDSLPPAPIGEEQRYGTMHAWDDYPAIHRLGIGWIRAEFGRLDVERIDEILAGSELDSEPREVNLVRTTGGHVLGLINVNDPKHLWARDKTEAYLEYIEEYAYRVAKTNAGYVKHWEIMNEPDYFWPEGSPKQVADITIAAAKGIRRADPGAFILSPCPTRPAYMEALLENGIGPVVDGFAIHLYSYDEALLDELHRYRQIFEKFGQDGKPIWVTETGYKSAVVQGTAEQEQRKWYEELQHQAEQLVKLNTLLINTGVERVFWYTATDVRSVYDGENFGLLWSTTRPNRGQGKSGNDWSIENPSLSVKPSGIAMHTLATMVAELPATGELNLGYGLHAYMYGKGKQQIVIAWADSTMPLAVPLSGDRLVVTSLYGKRSEVGPGADGLASAELGPEPVYLQGVDIEALTAKDCEIQWPERMAFSPGVESTYDLVFENRSDARLFRGTVSFLASPGIAVEPSQLSITLKPGEQFSKQVAFNVSPRLPQGQYSLQTLVDRSDTPPFVTRRPINVESSIGITATVALREEDKQLMCELTLRNRLAHPINGKLSIQDDSLGLSFEQAMRFDAVEEQRIDIPIERPDAETPCTFLANWQPEGGETIHNQVSLTEQLAVYAPVGVPLRGRLEDWLSTPSLIHLHNARYFVVNSPAGSYDGESDLAADCYAKWDGSNLYLAFYVKDDRHMQDADTFMRAWTQDSIQLVLDMGNQKRGTYDNDDFEIILDGGVESPRIGFVAAPLYGSGIFKDADLLVTPVPGGLLYETRIPLSRLGMQAPAAGDAIGFSFLVNDEDGDGQGRNWIEWTPGIGLSKDTSAYGNIRFVK